MRNWFRSAAAARPRAGGTGTNGPLVRVRGLRKDFGRHRALAGIDLELGEREIVGVVGPDGAGKTTLLRALAGLLEIEADQAAVLGHDLRGDVTELKALLGYVPQAFSLHRELSVIENLRFAARLHRLDAAAFAERSGLLLERTGLAPFVDRPAGALSGGMKQKLSVIYAMLTRPPLLLLDEPTAGVDVLARAEIWDMLVHERGHSLVLISTNYLDEAAACDRLIYLDGGRVVATGTPAELRARAALDIYRAWGDDPRAIARAARSLPYVDGARAVGRFARVEVRRDRAPEPPAVLRDLQSLAPAPVRLAEPAPADMESALVSLTRAASAPGAAA